MNSLHIVVYEGMFTTSTYIHALTCANALYKADRMRNMNTGLSIEFGSNSP
jgi:hypothetical protein